MCLAYLIKLTGTLAVVPPNPSTALTHTHTSPSCFWESKLCEKLNVNKKWVDKKSRNYKPHFRLKWDMSSTGQSLSSLRSIHGEKDQNRRFSNCGGGTEISIENVVYSCILGVKGRKIINMNREVVFLIPHYQQWGPHLTSPHPLLLLSHSQLE